MKKIYSITVRKTIEVDVVVYVKAQSSDDAIDAAHEYAITNWRKGRIPSQRFRQAGVSFSANLKDAIDVTHTDISHDLEV